MSAARGAVARRAITMLTERLRGALADFLTHLASAQPSTMFTRCAARLGARGELREDHVAFSDAYFGGAVD